MVYGAAEAADLVLLDHDLSVVLAGVNEGRRTVQNVTKYILMGSSSNLGNMFSMVGAALFLPMLPTQVLLNDLLHDLSEVGVPFDNVDPDALEKPVHLALHAGARAGQLAVRFPDVLCPDPVVRGRRGRVQTGWFIESLAQSLVIFVIRTRGRPWRSRPHPLLAALSVGVVAVGLLIPLTPLGRLFGFVLPPPGFYLFLMVTVAAYLLLVEAVKNLYCRKGARTSVSFLVMSR